MSGSETPLAAADVPAAALGPRSSLAGGAGPRRPVPGEPWPSRALLGPVNAQGPAVQLEPVELFDRRRRSRLLAELDESETSGPAGCAIAGKEHLYELAHLGEQGLQLPLRGFEAQVTDKKFVRYDTLLSAMAFRRRTSRHLVLDQT